MLPIVILYPFQVGVILLRLHPIRKDHSINCFTFKSTQMGASVKTSELWKMQKHAPNLRAGEEEGGKTGNQNITETNLQLTCSLDGQFAHIFLGGQHWAVTTVWQHCH